MNKHTLKSIGLALLATGLITAMGCKKDKPTSPASSNPASSPINTLQAFYSAYGVQNQTFTVNNTTGGTITGANGGKYFFPANFFQTPAKVVVSGNVTVTLKEIFSPRNMVLSNMPTTTATRGLLSQGEFNITAKQGNQNLIANGNFAAHLPMIDTTPLAMDSEQVWNFNPVTWGWSNSYGSYAYSLGSNPDSIVINSDSIDWLNADCFYPNGPFYTIYPKVANSPDISQTAIYIFVNGHKAIWQAYYLSGTKFQTPGDIPQGAPLTIIGLAVSSDGTVYSSFTPYTNPGNNDTVNITLSATTAGAFSSQMAALK